MCKLLHIGSEKLPLRVYYGEDAACDCSRPAGDQFPPIYVPWSWAGSDNLHSSVFLIWRHSNLLVRLIGRGGSRYCCAIELHRKERIVKYLVGVTLKTRNKRNPLIAALDPDPAILKYLPSAFSRTASAWAFLPKAAELLDSLNESPAPELILMDWHIDETTPERAHSRC